MSCPGLPKFLFDGDSLDTQFEEQAQRFINGHGVEVESKNHLKNHQIKHTWILAPGSSYKLNPIFNWFKKDFDASVYGSILSFVNHYIKV